MTVFVHEMLSALADRGFKTQWVSLSAASVGSPQRRRRIFMLAKRGSALAVKFGPALPRGASGVLANAPAADVRLDARLPWLRERRGLDFNSGRPPAIEWMMSAEQYKHDRHRLKLLGNAIVPLQANLAARIMASSWAPGDGKGWAPGGGKGWGP